MTSDKLKEKEKITVTEKGVRIMVPAIINNEVVTIDIGMGDILKVLIHYGKQMPLLFLYVSPGACQKTRKLLKMTNRDSFYLEVTSTDETQKRITILPEKINEESKTILKQHFGDKIQELENKDANEILVRSSPKDNQRMREKMTGQMMAVEKKSAGGGGDGPGQAVKLCQYPPDTAGNVSVTNEDYNCLEAEQFLNDVIIDFYLKFLQHGKFKDIKEVMDRTHIFTTYFYNRLTTRKNGKGKVAEDNSGMTAAEKRYDRVERWTKKVNLFDKDFIVVPINEHAHWFVCVICFPGQLGCVNVETGEKCDPPTSQFRSRGPKTKRRTVKKPVTIGSTTITRVIPMKDGRDDIKFLDDDGSDRDEAEASDEDFDEDEEEKTLEEVVDAKIAVRQPCILTFDSLAAGSSKARTHQTLREYLSCEWKKRMVSQGHEERIFSKDNMPGASPKVQQQPNFSDCGIYLLQYVESFFRDPIKDYTLPIKSVNEWFTKEEVESKRDTIATLIRDLAADQNPNKEFSYPQLNFFNPPEEEFEDDEDDDENYGDDPIRVGQNRTGAGNVQINGNKIVRVSGSGTVVVTPSKGQVLITKTGGSFKVCYHYYSRIHLCHVLVQMPPYSSSVPAGVTVTPSSVPGPPIRQISSNNISVGSSHRCSLHVSISVVQVMKMNVVQTSQSGDTVQTSPDSTSHEPDPEPMLHTAGQDPEQDSSGDHSSDHVSPDSQSSDSDGAVNNHAGQLLKRTAVGETEDSSPGVKRIKSGDVSES